MSRDTIGERFDQMRRRAQIVADETDDAIVIHGLADAVVRQKIRRLTQRQRHGNPHVLGLGAFGVGHADMHDGARVLDTNDVKL